MTNLLLPFECPICGSDGFRQVEVKGQHFDRKDAGQAGSALSTSAVDNIRDLVIKTVSSFANSNVEGGLLALGISKKGEITGVDHLAEKQKNSVTGLNTLLRAHA